MITIATIIILVIAVLAVVGKYKVTLITDQELSRKIAELLKQ
jgi:hypothetical protein